MPPIMHAHAPAMADAGFGSPAGVTVRPLATIAAVAPGSVDPGQPCRRQASIGARPDHVIDPRAVVRAMESRR